ncbi:MAG TPA: hypothetical protein PK370_03555 [Candidatus Woesebacteria bacterium]|nr:hypothetical protein [Candidatus Woesebacteria bacterium]HPJ17344.1 hypothetical protein [Candidatus Woesebacteria bacterium]
MPDKEIIKSQCLDFKPSVQLLSPLDPNGQIVGKEEEYDDKRLDIEDIWFNELTTFLEKNPTDSLTVQISFPLDYEKLPRALSGVLKDTERFLLDSGITPDSDGLFTLCIGKDIYPKGQYTHGSATRDLRLYIRRYIQPEEHTPQVYGPSIRIDPFGEKPERGFLLIPSIMGIKIHYGGELTGCYDRDSKEMLSGEEIKRDRIGFENKLNEIEQKLNWT